MFKSLDIQKDMEVVGLDGKHVGTVDHLETADRIILSKDDPKAGGRPAAPGITRKAFPGSSRSTKLRCGKVASPRDTAIIVEAIRSMQASIDTQFRTASPVRMSSVIGI